MSNLLWITEYSGAGDERTQIAKSPAQTRQTVAIGAVAHSNPLGPNTHLVRIKADGADCIYVISSADANGNYIAATTTVGDLLLNGETEYIGAHKNQQISVISRTGS